MPSPTPFSNEFNPIVDGQAVNANNTNRPIQTVEQRTRALKEQIDAALFGTSNVIREATVQSSEVKVGMPVYRNEDGVFCPSLAALDTAPDGATLQPADSAYVWGVVSHKYSNTVADIVTAGQFSLTTAELEAISVEGTAITGPVFLTPLASKKGHIQTTQPPIGVTVGILNGPDENGDYLFHVNVKWGNPMEGHIHLHHRVPNNTNWEAAAAYESRTGLDAPAGGVYHYRHDLDAVLSVLWPPIPIGAVHYDIDGVASDLVNNTQILIDDSGIWWTDGVNPHTAVRHDFYFTKMTFKTKSALVTSLRSNSTALTVKNSDGATAAVGDLYLDLGLTLGSSDDAFTGLAVKSHNDLTLNYGPVVEGLATDTPTFVQLEGTSFNHDGDPYVGGLVRLNVLSPDLAREGPIEFIDVNNVEIDEASGLVYVALKNSSNTGTFLGRFQTPYIGYTGDSFQVTLDMLVWSRAAGAGTMPDLDVEYLVVDRPATVETPASLSTSYTSHPDGIKLSDVGSVSAGYYFRYSLVLTTCDPGAVVYFQVSRNGVGGFAGDIGILNMRWRVDPV